MKATQLPAEYAKSMMKLASSASRGSVAFYATKLAMWQNAEGPFKVCSHSGCDYGQAFYHRPDSVVHGCLIQVKASYARPTTMMMAFVAPTEQLNQRIANDPLIPDDIDDITTENWEPICRQMCSYQVEMDQTIRRKR